MADSTDIQEAGASEGDKPESKVGEVPAAEGELKLSYTYKKIVTVNFTARPTDTISEVKRKIQDREGTPAEELRIVFGGEVLMNNRMLRDYGISDGAYLKSSLLYLNWGSS